jgi:hypothetical protein
MINLTGRPRPASSTDTIEVFKSLVGASYPRPYSYTASARLDLARLASASTSDGEMIVTDAAIGEGWCPRVARGHLLILIAPGASRALRLLCLFQELAAAALGAEPDLASLPLRLCILRLTGIDFALASHEPLVHRVAAFIHAGGPSLRAVGKRHEQLGQLRVAVLLDKPRHTVAPVPIARLADNRERRREDI